MPNRFSSSVAERAAYEEGQRRGVAIAGLAVALVAFIQLFGVEKALLAIVLGVLSMRGAAKDESAYGWGRTIIGISILYMILVATSIIVFHSTFSQLLRLLQKIG